MAIGNNIKILRNRKGLTQKELAELLHVTYQAVSRWEKDDVEPSIETLKEMTKVFDCSLDELFGVETEKPEEPQVVERVIVQEAKPVLAVCAKCNKPIYDGDDLVRINARTNTIYCKECNEQRLQEIHEEKLKGIGKRRLWSFIGGGIAFIVFLVLAIICFVDKDNEGGLYQIIMAVMSFTFVSCLVLNNTFVPDMWEGIASWGFVKLPGVIFDLSLDGIIWLLTVKLLFWILGFILAVIAFIFATIVGLFVSVFVYPFALYRNLKNIE